MKLKTYILIFFCLFILTTVAVMFWGTENVSNLEHKMITGTEPRIESITHYAFEKSGLLIIGKDKFGKGEIYALVQMPGMNRYWITDKRYYSDKQENSFAASDFYHGVVLEINHGAITIVNKNTGFGYWQELLWRMLISAFIASVLSLPIVLLSHKYKKRET